MTVARRRNNKRSAPAAADESSQAQPSTNKKQRQQDNIIHDETPTNNDSTNNTMEIENDAAVSKINEPVTLLTNVASVGSTSSSQPNNETTSNSMTIPTAISQLASNVYDTSSKATQSLLLIIDEIMTLIINNSSTRNSTLLLQLLEKAHITFLQLKRYQRALTLSVGSHLQSQVAHARNTLEAQTLALQNMTYERQHLQNSIQSCRQFHSKHLLQMAKDEMILDYSNSNSINHSDSAADDETKIRNEPLNSSGVDHHDQDDQIIHSYLNQQDDQNVNNNQTETINNNDSKIPSHKDPSQHQRNLLILNSQLAMRGDLVNELQAASEQKQKMEAILQSKLSFLQSFPEQIQQIEKSTLSLLDFFQKYPQQQQSNSTMMEQWMGSEEQKQRFHLATLLPTPLYTLFVQFQGYIENNIHLHHDHDGEQTMFPTVNIVDSNLISANTTNTAEDNTALALNSNDTVNGTSSETQELMHYMKKDEYLSKWLQIHPKALQLSISLPIKTLLLLQSCCPSLQKHNTLMQILQNQTKKKHGHDVGINTDKDNCITIQFQYMTHLKIVTAYVVGTTSNAGYNITSLFLHHPKSQSILLLKNLFGNSDDGTSLPDGCISNIYYSRDTELDNCHSDNDEDQKRSEPYQHPAPLQFQDEEDVLVDYDYNDDDEEDRSSPNYCYKKVDQKKENAWSELTHIFLEGTAPGVGNPYNWCQHLSGMYYPKETASDSSNVNQLSDSDNVVTNKSSIRMEASTKALIQALYRRVRSHIVLNMILTHMNSLPKSIPVHPSIDNSPSSAFTKERMRSCQSKLTDWYSSENTNAIEDGSLYYEAKIENTMNKIFLVASVRLDIRYPAVLPLWSLQIGNKEVNIDDGTKSSHDYYSTLRDIEKRVNVLSENVDLVTDDVEESFDWVILHQLREIILSWDEEVRCQSLEGSISAKKNTASSIVVQTGEDKRQSNMSHDRRPILGYELYRKGL